MSEEAGEEEQEQASRPDRRFALLFFALISFGLTSVYAINRIVDPFGANEWRLVPALIQSSRNKKLSLLAGFPKDTNTLILGSSRQLRVLPKDLEEHLAGRAFNAAVTGGGPQDALAMTRIAREEYDLPIKNIVIGIDLERLSPINALFDELLKNPRMLSYLPEGTITRDQQPAVYQELTTLRLRKSLKALWLEARDAWPKPVYAFDEDGVRRNLKAEREIEAGSYDFEGALDATLKRYRDIYAEFTHFDEFDMKALGLFFDYCDEHEIKLWIYLSPSHPRLIETIAAETEQPARRQEFIEFITPVAKERGYVFRDFTEIASFGGRAEDYYDGSHPTDANTKRLLAALFK